MSDDDLALGLHLEVATRGRILATDDWVADALAAASKAVRVHCGWRIAPVTTETVTIDGTGSSLIFLPSLHVTDIDTVVNDGTTLVVDEDFEWSANGVMEKASLWTPKRRGVVVTFTHGYSLSDVPEVVNLVCKVAARTVMAARAAGVVHARAGVNDLELATHNGVLADAELFEHEKAALSDHTIPR